MHRVEQRDGASIVHVSGKLDVSSSQALASIIKVFKGSHAQRVVVSLEDCNYCYAVGLAVLVAAQDKLGRNLFVVVPVGARFIRIFEITGLSKVLQLVPTIQGALDCIGDAEVMERAVYVSATKRVGLRVA